MRLGLLLALPLAACRLDRSHDPGSEHIYQVGVHKQTSGAREGFSAEQEAGFNEATSGTAGSRASDDGFEWCIPEPDGYLEARRVVNSRCGACHGPEPKFGAPMALDSYLALYESREVVLGHLADGSMPPIGMEPPTDGEFALLVDWLSCGGHAHYPYQPTLESAGEELDGGLLRPESREVEAVRKLELTSERFALTTEVDRYQSTFYESLVERDMLIRRFEPIIDQDAVVHHIGLSLWRGEQVGDHINYLYVWAPGTGAIDFPSGGVRLRPDDTLRLEVHYNNPSGALGIVDSSGVRLLLDDIEDGASEYVFHDFFAGPIFVPPFGSSEVTSYCEAEVGFDVMATLPHMHRTGTSIHSEIHRLSGDTDVLVSVPSWSFDTQLMYDTEARVDEGDVISVTCEFRNTSASPVLGGLRTTDEMCIVFAYVTPVDIAERLRCY